MRKFRLVTIGKERQIAEDFGHTRHEHDKDGNLIEALEYSPDSVEFEPIEREDFYTWNDNQEIIINEAKKQKAMNAQKIRSLKSQLDNDYRYKKRIDGEYTDEEWQPIAAERRAWRQELRELEGDEN